MLPLALTIAAFWVIVAFMENIVTECMNLVFLVPGQVFTWVGGHFGSNVGMSGAGSTARGAEQGIGQAGEVGQSAGRGALSGVGGAGEMANKARENRAANADAKAAGFKNAADHRRQMQQANMARDMETVKAAKTPPPPQGAINNGGAPGKVPGGKSNVE